MQLTQSSGSWAHLFKAPPPAPLNPIQKLLAANPDGITAPEVASAMGTPVPTARAALRRYGYVDRWQPLTSGGYVGVWCAGSEPDCPRPDKDNSGISLAGLVQIITPHIVVAGDCWEWVGARFRHGGTPMLGIHMYGVKKSVPVRRLICEVRGDDLDARIAWPVVCDNQRCVNPDHIGPIYRIDMAERLRRQRAAQ